VSPAVETLTAEQARSRLGEHLRAAVERIEPRPALEDHLVGTMACDDPTDGGPPGRVFVESHHWLRGIAPDRNPDVFDALHAYWSGHGYAVMADLRHERPAPELQVRHAGDGFSLSLVENLDGELLLAGSSPCVWPEGHPPGEPETDAKS
jgi:hypothetical protein